MIEYVKKSDVLEIINSPLPRDLTAEYIFDLKGVWLDEDEADAPQTELTAKCLNCRNAKACKENHWDGCIYEPQTDCEDIYPLVIIKDRYTGTYSNGEYTAWNMYFEDIPREIDEDDVTCHNFWHSYNGIVGLGKTPNEAIDDLRKKLNAERNE